MDEVSCKAGETKNHLMVAAFLQYCHKASRVLSTWRAKVLSLLDDLLCCIQPVGGILCADATVSTVREGGGAYASCYVFFIVIALKTRKKCLQSRNPEAFSCVDS